jgi:hypothetical protein
MNSVSGKTDNGQSINMDNDTRTLYVPTGIVRSSWYKYCEIWWIKSETKSERTLPDELIENMSQDENSVSENPSWSITLMRMAEKKLSNPLLESSFMSNDGE